MPNAVAPLWAGWARGNRNLPGPLQGASPPVGVQLLPGVLPDALFAVEMAFGADLDADPYGLTWIWVDVSRDVLQFDDGKRAISITSIGRGSQSYLSSPAGCGFILKNPAGDYTRHNPYSKYWPNVTKNIPVRVRVSLDGGGTLSVRFQGETAGLNPVWDTSGDYAVVAANAAGILQRIQTTTTPLRSAMYRQVAQVDTTRPDAYYPMEEVAVAGAQGSLADQVFSFAEASGGPAFTLTSGGQMAGAVAAPAGSASLASITTAHNNNRTLMPGSSDTFWGIQFAATLKPFDSSIILTTLLDFTLDAGATWQDLEFYVDPTAGEHFQLWTNDGFGTKLTDYQPPPRGPGSVICRSTAARSRPATTTPCSVTLARTASPGWSGCAPSRTCRSRSMARRAPSWAPRARCR